MFSPRFHHHGSPILQRFPTVFTRNFRPSSRLWLPRSSVNITTKSTPETLRFRDELIRSTSPKSFSDRVRYPGIRNQILFFTFGSFVAYSVAAKLTNYDTSYWAQKLSLGSSIWIIGPPGSDQMRKARYFEYAKVMQNGLDKVRTTVESLPMMLKSFATWAYIYAAQPLVDAKEGRRVCWTIAAMNTGIWVLWQIPRLRPIMRTSFTHNPLSGKSYTMLTSTFSHKSFLHLLFNSMALTSFGSATCEYFIREQANSPLRMQESTIQYHLIAFLISAGLFSSLASHMISARITFPRLVSKITKTKIQPTTTQALSTSVKESIRPSLGVSGAIYSAVVVTALAYPQSEIALIFPPTPPIPIQWGVGALVTLDCIGVIRGWRLFNHYAHLGGVVFGVFYYAYGPEIWDFFRTINPMPYRSSSRSRSD
ncbi:hypothetical protein BDM02DRAFT_3155410 [Thelephora ganbajun]|uniref:Uncharacterized protein n=1 Tax=Thelephora ganbajun TaxID=370292 RepID=A0ACB6ZIA0_THEGA|nr:hypothetical protein BDM02DRAFT_3155410 [Thelephora ganbajun]